MKEVNFMKCADSLEDLIGVAREYFTYQRYDGFGYGGNGGKQRQQYRWTY